MRPSKVPSGGCMSSSTLQHFVNHLDAPRRTHHTEPDCACDHKPRSICTCRATSTYTSTSLWLSTPSFPTTPAPSPTLPDTSRPPAPF